MKITKFLPLALALTLAVPAFAAEGDGSSATSELQITVPQFIYIKNNADEVLSTNATFNTAYSTISLNDKMSASFNVITNNPDQKVKLTATALAGGAQVNALYGDADALNLVFTNIGTGTRAASGDAVTDILKGATAAKNNPNAIAFSLTPSVTAVDDTGAAAAKANKKDSSGVEYEITNGEYNFKYEVGQAGLANTFSTHDTDGTYQATLTLSKLSI